MKKTFITTMPDRIGAFLAANEKLSAIGVNITRVSYNKAIDTHTLFLEIEGEEKLLSEAETILTSLGYLKNDAAKAGVILLEFHLKDEPNRLYPILVLIQKFNFNISYMSSQENESGYQDFKIGIYVEDETTVSSFLENASRVCPVKVLHYDKSEKILDNTVFYLSFAETLAEKMKLNEKEKEGLLVSTNKVMQMLDEEGSPFYKTFDYISRLASHIRRYKGSRFQPRITKEILPSGTELVNIEPPCGSNITILTKGQGLLFVDSGFACYRKEMMSLLDELCPHWQAKQKTLLLTHSDVDHAGLLDLFDAVYLTEDAALDFANERVFQNAYREENPLHQPYAYISKILTKYRPPKADNLHPISGQCREGELLHGLGTVEAAGFAFHVYSGAGGHVKGEAVFVEEKERLVFTGDIFVNIKDFTKEQKSFTKLAPYLMTSVDTDPALAKREREAVFELLDEGTWKIIGGHGGIFTTNINQS